MNKQKWILAVVTLLLIGAAAGLLGRFKTNQRLGQPGVIIDPVTTNRSQIVLLPERILDYESELVDQQDIVLNTLPRDTSFGSRRYQAPDDFWVQATVVLMKGDRTSLHKPQFCLEGAGWSIDANASREDKVRITQPEEYDLPVMKLLVTKRIQHQGQTVTLRGVYVYWFVAEDAYTAQHWQRMWWMAKELIQTGVLQRWAYVTYFAVCLPGQEDATFERLQKLIAASVPEIQLVPKPAGRVAATQP